MQPHSCGMGGCVGCHRPPRSALTWRAGNQSLWCLILSLKIDSSGLFGDCCSATWTDSFEVLEQHFSGCCESRKADTNAALGNGHQGRGEDDVFVPNGIFPCHPWVSWPWLSAGGFVHLSSMYASALGTFLGLTAFALAEMHLLGVKMAEKGREVFKHVPLFLGA